MLLLLLLVLLLFFITLATDANAIIDLVANDTSAVHFIMDAIEAVTVLGPSCSCCSFAVFFLLILFCCCAAPTYTFHD